MRDIDIAILSVCPWRSGIRWKWLYILSVFSPYGSPIILVFQHQTSLQNSDEVTPCGALNTGGVRKFRDFLPIAISRKRYKIAP